VKYDYWHLNRLFAIEGAEGQALPFGGPPTVYGDVVVLAEPVWRAAMATATRHGVPSVFELLPPRGGLAVADAQAWTAAAQQLLTGTSYPVAYPEELDDTSLPDEAAVRSALNVIRQLLEHAASQGRRVVTWGE
jgi:hypothetical protein